ncbi:hypothetical protein [uncultured Clostridium sp.]|jgi:hypothetical protein|uniref:hypothetical protein n=1 Tax=uncultured Clostridium sp. TaxID=59620 RepID=UPI0026317D72|nr:hypothetical protein [uncultured Clostridium sp.]
MENIKQNLTSSVEDLECSKKHLEKALACACESSDKEKIKESLCCVDEALDNTKCAAENCCELK